MRKPDFRPRRRRRARADRRGERLGKPRGGPGRQSLPRGQRRHLAVQAAEARAGADSAPPQRPKSAPMTAAIRPRSKTELDVDRTIQVDAKGLPVCRQGQLKASTTAAAKQACPDAIVGSGTAEVEVAFPEQAPFSANGPVLLFNGGVHGGTTLLFSTPTSTSRRRPPSSPRSSSPASTAATSASTSWRRSRGSPAAPAR